MNPLKSVETTIASLVEGTFGRIFRSEVRPIELARKLAVSERTIYRDVQDLGRSGVPIEGEAGVGYILRGFDIPPLMFTREEIEALVVGARMVETWTTDQLAAAARQALDKIEAALPERLKAEIAKSRMIFAPSPVCGRQSTRFARPSRRPGESNSTIARRTAGPRAAQSSPWVSTSGETCGRWQDGASSAKIFAIFGWTEWSGLRLVRHTRLSRGARSTTTWRG